MFVVELKNKYRLQINNIIERVTSKTDNDKVSLVLKLEITDLDIVLSTNMDDIAKQFVPNNLSLIKIYASDKATEPIALYTNYKKISAAIKDISNKSLTISLTCDNNAE